MRQRGERLYWARRPGISAGFIVHDGWCRADQTAPILRRLVAGKSERHAIAALKAAGYEVELVK